VLTAHVVRCVLCCLQDAQLKEKGPDFDDAVSDRSIAARTRIDVIAV
jgi:hypothetical protein